MKPVILKAELYRKGADRKEKVILVTWTVLTPTHPLFKHTVGKNELVKAGIVPGARPSNPPVDLLHMAVWNELRATLTKWDKMNDALERNDRTVTKGEHDNTRMKIEGLLRQLDNIEKMGGI